MSVTPLTAQQVFDRVWNHFIVDHKPRSVSFAAQHDGQHKLSCRYRDKKGNSCAFGLFIPDEQYNSEMEDTTISQIFTAFPGLKAQFDSSVITDNPARYTQNLLEALQEVHDDYEEREDMEREFRLVADQFNLTVPT